jgi:hypothetical protein
MGESWASANARMACFDCGESGAKPYTTSHGNHVRVCLRCIQRWECCRLVPREPMFDEPREDAIRAAKEGE